MNRPDPPKRSPKKPYRKPALEKYGDVRKLTRQVGNNGMNDSMGSSFTMTGL